VTRKDIKGVQKFERDGIYKAIPKTIYQSIKLSLIHFTAASKLNRKLLIIKEKFIQKYKIEILHKICKVPYCRN